MRDFFSTVFPFSLRAISFSLYGFVDMAAEELGNGVLDVTEAYKIKPSTCVTARMLPVYLTMIAR
jgi:hypothetical protein